MANFHSAQSATFNEGSFNALLTHLNETVNQLAELYQKDVEAVLKENEKLHVKLGDRSAGTNSQRGGASASCWEKEANDMILNEMKLQESSPLAPPEPVARRQSQDGTLLESVDIDCSSSVVVGLLPELVGKTAQTHGLKTKGVTQYYRMRSPWIDQRAFDRVPLQDVMSEEIFELCLSGKVHVRGLRVTKLEDKLTQRGKMSSLVIHPESKARGYWILACMALLVYDFIMVPVDVCFDLEETKFSKAMDVTAAIFWTMDIVFTFFVGVRQAHAVENRPAKIAWVYLKSWFIFDMFLVVSAWATMGIADDNFSGGQVSVFRVARWGRFMRLLRMARIMRIAKLKPVMRRLVYVLNLSKAWFHLMQALTGLSVGMLAFIHIISCIWYAIGDSSDDGWVAVNGLRSASVGQAYAASVHWSFSRLHGLQTYNQIESVTELFLDALLIYLSLMLVAFYNGTVAAVAMTSANAQSFNLWKLSVIFVKRHRISSGLDTKMLRFLECSGIGGAMEAAAEEQMLLESLPKTLQQDLLFEARLPFLTKKQYINHLLAANPRIIRQICTEAITQKVFVDGEVAFANGDACHGMLFVTSGVLFYVLDNSEESLESIQDKLYNPMSMGPLRSADSRTRQLENKSSVSEPVLWTHWTHVGSLLTIEESTCLLLSPLEFSQVIEEHREALCYAFKYARHFLWKLNHATNDIDDLTAFPEITITDLDTNIFEGTEYDHFMFLSHYKVEAGTEATLMRDLFQEILREDPNHSANNFRSPIFVDSEDLTDLSKLKQHVIGSDALVLLLTPGVLSRPWCLVEIVTAVNHKVNIVPVDIQRPGSKYNYPDDQFYADILNGKFLNPAAVSLLEGEGISLLDVEKAIRQVFLKIALPFSPHKTKGVREAELHDILARSIPGQAALE